ncbi:hypothetical protein [Halobacillus litoralis]|uniref:hypothetical protein n=1 Tax=Halobacillus litoralis TaxID=45668 RepID=UPI001CFCDB86|nr:hypothetical protein [Halobacillus litoralis]
MSERKKVIRVKDLVIQADNVIIEPQRRNRHEDREDWVDPFFGPRRRVEAAEESSSSSSSRHHKDESSDRREGFRWF